MKLHILTLLSCALIHFSFATEKEAGPFVEYYDNGNIKIEGTYTDKGIRGGTWKEYFENGQVKCVKNYKRDYLVDTYKEFFENGSLKTEGTYSPFQTKKEGVWKEYYENGELKLQAQYHQDQFCGIYLQYYINGNLSLKGEYDYFKFTKKGDWIEYYEDGKIKKQEFYNIKGVLESKSTSYYQSGSIKETGEYEYLLGKKDGKWIAFYESGDTMSVSYFRQGSQVGAFYEFYEGGSPKLICEYNFSGNLNGLYYSLDENGETLSKGTYEDGVKTGKWLVRDELGELKKERY